jgi:hypothetical protein
MRQRPGPAAQGRHHMPNGEIQAFHIRGLIEMPFSIRPQVMQPYLIL